MTESADQALIAYVQQVIRTGSRTIRIPARLLEQASDEAIREVKAFCKISGVTIEAVDA